MDECRDRAFPVRHLDNGMFLVDYFAAQVASELANVYVPEVAAKRSYDVAEALMAEREKRLG